MDGLAFGNTPPLLAQRVVAFVDILGFRTLVKQACQGEGALLTDIYNILHLVAAYAQLTNDGPFGVKSLSPHLQATAFSDCVVVSDVASHENIEGVLGVVAFIGSALLARGILCRGAIVAGPTIHEERVLLGVGMVAAYELEQQAAVYPRVIISDDLVSQAKRSRLHRVKRDIDGFWFLDLFFEFSGLLESLAAMVFCREVSLTPKLEAFDRIRGVIIKRLEDEKNPSIIAKWRWVANQFNQAIVCYPEARIAPVGI